MSNFKKSVNFCKSDEHILQNTYILAKLGANTADNEQTFAMLC